jgi:hypothetical protein
MAITRQRRVMCIVDYASAYQTLHRGWTVFLEGNQLQFKYAPIETYQHIPA